MTIKDRDAQAFQDRCRAIRPILGKQADAFWTAWLFADEVGKAELREQLDLIVNAHLNRDVQDTTPTFHPPGQAEASGDITLGTVHYNSKDMYPFGLNLMELVQHTSIVARTGGGKSNAAYLLASNLTRAGIPWLCLDWKQSWRRLRNLPDFRNLRVYTVGRDVAPLHINPLIPLAGVDPRNHLKAVVECILKAYFCGDGVGFLLTTVLDELYQKHGIYSGAVTRYPTFRDVLAKLKTIPAAGRVSLWLASATRAVHALCFGAMDAILNSGDNTTMEDLLSEPTVLEFESLTHADKLFCSEILLLGIYSHRMVKNERNKLCHITIIEEAHHLLSRLQHSGPASIVEVIFREVRELSEGILFLDQAPAEISKTALSNTYTTIAMNLKGKQDVATISAAMLLQDDQGRALGTMDIGQAIVKLQGRIKEPFMISIPEMKIPALPVTDDDLRRQSHLVRARNNPQADQASFPALSETESAFLRDVALLSESGVVSRYRRLNLSMRQGAKVRQSLVDAGLLEESEVVIPTGRKTVIRLTERGKAHLGDFRKIP